MTCRPAYVFRSYLVDCTVELDFTAFAYQLCDMRQAWMVNPVKLAERKLLRVEPKVHSGFHAAWTVSGLKAAVMKIIQANIPPDAAARTHVYLTGARMRTA